MSGYAGKRSGSQQPPDFGPSKPLANPGKRTLTEQIAVPAAPAVQRRATPELGAHNEASVHAAASQGIATPASSLPYGASIQQLFGRHDVSSVQAHTGSEAARSARAMGADAYATGNHVVLGDRTDLHTVAHEAAHVVQQRSGVQLKGGVGAVGDAYERHADAVADRVVAGHSAEDLLDGGVARGATTAVQRKENPDDAKILDNQASLKDTDVEIPVLEGALLATRKEAVKRGLLSQASYDACLALSRAMTQLQPAVAAKGAIDEHLQKKAADAAQQLFEALQRETADEKNFQIQPSPPETSAIKSQNPYTDEDRVTTYFFGWITSQTTFGGFQHLPEFIRQGPQGKWDDAFRAYRGLLDGLDLWVADQLRKTGKGTQDEALGNAHQHHAHLLTGLEQIAGKHAKRLPALFHPDPKTIEKEKAAGHPVAASVPMNVYFWKDDQDGKFHIYDLTTPSHPQEQTVDGPPTAAMMNTFFEEVARYPKGEVRYTLPGNGVGVAPTTGKIKWYEWVAYAGLAASGVGLALLTAGFSVTATYLFAVGSIAGGASAGGHLYESRSLGTDTTFTVALDLVQIAASLVSARVLAITVISRSAALTGSGYVLVGIDLAQLIVLTADTYNELNKIQQGAGTREDKQRAMMVLLTQLIAAGALTVLSLKGARDGLSGSSDRHEIVDQNGKMVLRKVGESTHAEAKPTETEGHKMFEKTEPPADTIRSSRPTIRVDTAQKPADDWIAHLRSQLAPDAQAQLDRELKGKTPQQIMDSFGGNFDTALASLSTPGAAPAVQLKDTVDQFCVGSVPKSGPERRKYIETPAHWPPARARLHDDLIAKAKGQAQQFADAVQKGEPTIYAMRGNTAAGKTRAVSGSVEELKGAMAATKDLPHRSVNPDNFKVDLIAATPGATSTQVHAESSMLATRLERELAAMKTSDGKELGSILIDKRLDSLGDVQRYAQMAKDTGRRFVLYDVDAPLEVSLAGVLERVPGGADPLPPFDVVATGFKGVRDNRAAVIKLFASDPTLGTYELYATIPQGDRVQIATIRGGTTTTTDAVRFVELTAAVDDQATLLGNKRISDQVIRDVTQGLPPDRQAKVRGLLEKYEGWTWKSALDAHSVEKPRGPK